MEEEQEIIYMGGEQMNDRQETQHAKLLNAPLVQFNMDLSTLKDYLDNMIQVINQHAKLLKTLNREIMARTTEK